MKTKLIRFARNQRKLSQDDVIFELNSQGVKCTRQRYGDWEKGRTNISVQDLEILSKILGRDFTDFLGKDD